jgi:hypothetical protein
MHVAHTSPSYHLLTMQNAIQGEAFVVVVGAIE